MLPKSDRKITVQCWEMNVKSYITHINIANYLNQMV